MTILTNNELSTIVRHEFGHAMGIGHSTDPDDLMFDTISTDLPYITNCHIGAMITLYNGEHAGNFECEK